MMRLPEMKEEMKIIIISLMKRLICVKGFLETHTNFRNICTENIENYIKNKLVF